MSQIEDAAVTVERLLRKQMHLVMDNGALGSVSISDEFPNNDALKAGEGQITVSLAESTDQKLNLTGNIRRQTSTLRVNTWATDNSAAVETGKTLRNKIAAEVNRIILQNRNKPNETKYDFYGLTADDQASKGFSGGAEAAPMATWTELSNTEYQTLWYSDDRRCQITQTVSGNYAVLLLGFKLESRRDTVQNIILTFEGYGIFPSGYGVTVKVWNNSEAAWQNNQSYGENSSDHTFNITIASSAVDFIDDSNYVWLLARTSSPSDGASSATLFCDYTSCTVTVNGATYCDITNRRNIDRIDIKPPIYRTEFTVKTSLIEKIGE